MTLIIDMFSGTGELARAISSALARDLTADKIRLIQTWETVTGVYAPPTDQTRHG